jgi:5-methylcytosine-specific restriction endonuclease McrA
MGKINSFRDYFDKSLEFFIEEQSKLVHPYNVYRHAMLRLRCYASLYTRDMRKVLINENSTCAICYESENLQLDHVIPISKGGKNELLNLQILCKKCNREKGNKI